jgi:hypothetical protein
MPAVRVRVSMGAMGSEGANSAELARDADDATAIESCAADLGAAKLVRLRDGSWVTVRAAGAGDEPALLVFLSELCLEARRMRFFTGAADIEYAAHLGAASGRDRLGLIVHDEGGRTVGHAAYVKLDEERAEVAVEVATADRRGVCAVCAVSLPARSGSCWRPDRGTRTSAARCLPCARSPRRRRLPAL